MRNRIVWLLLAVALTASPVRAETLSSVLAPSPATSTFQSPAPAQRGILPTGLFDPKRFSIHNSLTFGFTSGGAYQGSAGLFTSSLGYQMRNNMRLSVDVGAHVNPAFGSNTMQKGIFVEGAALDWQPTRNSLIRVEYRDVRSPLQQGYWGAPYGYGYGYNPGYGFGYGSSSLYGAGGTPPLGSGLAGDPLRN
jgi:hypothetical protein